MSKKKIIIERDTAETVLLDCPNCNVALKDWDDYLSAKTFGLCHDCKTNKTKENIEDN